MPIYLDEKLIEPQGDDLQSALDEADTILQDTSRIVIEVKIDGHVLLGEEFDTAAGIITIGKKIEFMSGEPAQLANDALREIIGDLDQARRLHIQAAEAFQQDQTESAMQCINQITEIWQQVIHAVTLVSPIKGIDIEVDEYQNQKITQLTDDLLQKLSELKVMIQDSDTLGIADVLSYEWPETVDAWEKFIQWMISHD